MSYLNEFPIRDTLTYLNTATQGPWPNRTTHAVQEAAVRAQFVEADRAKGEPSVFDEARARLGRLVNTSPDNLVFGANTTFGLNVLVHGIDWRAGDNIVLPEREFPSVQYAVVNLPPLGVEIRRVAWINNENLSGPSVDTIMAEVNNRTRAVICSAISWDTGYRMDLETLGARCARAGCLLFVDGIHAVGAENLNLNILGVSGMSFHSYKWLCAGFGIGGLYVSPQAVDQIRPTFVGPQGVDGDLTAYQNNPQWRKGAQRFSAGTGNAIGATALNASLSLLEEVGVNAICQNNHMLATALADGIKQALPQARLLRSPNHVNQSAIVVFTTGSHANDAMLVAKLESNGVVVAHRPQGIRVSPHFFNTLQDIEKFLAAL